MKNRIISLLLALLLLFSFVACGTYNAPDEDNDEIVDDEQGSTGGGDSSDNNEAKGEPFVVTVMLNGKIYTPPPGIR